jgi:hypothetical protein
MAWKRRSKHNAVPQTYDGERYHSGLEMRYAKHLDTLRKARAKADRVVDVKRQVKASLDVNGVHIANYFIDFVVTYGDGRVEWVEVKGFGTDVWKMKAKLFEALHPEKSYRIVWAKDVPR